MSNVVKKVGGAIGIGPKKKADPIAMAEIATGKSVKSMTEELSVSPQQTEAQAGAAAARKKRGGRVGQRGLLYASRLGGRGGGRGDTQDTLGSA
jgi:hypothetical protein